ncbi:MAG: hypothetical protein ACTIDA_00310 [Pseudolactococcus laudensis]
MRNFASSKVTTDWIFFVDSDEVLFETIDKNILRNIAALLASLSNEKIMRLQSRLNICLA